MANKFGFQITVKERTIWIFPEDIDAAVTAGKSAAIAYSWTRSAGEDPIELGTIDDLVDFVDVSIIQNMPDFMDIPSEFSARKEFDNVLDSLPNPFGSGLENFAKNA